MIKPNLFFATPVWTIQLDKYEDINEELNVIVNKN